MRSQGSLRRIAAFVLASVCLLVAGCSGSAEKNDGELKIVCTIFPQYDLARSIAENVEGVSVKMLLGAGQESHEFDPSSKDIAAVHECDVFIYTGGQSDVWVEDMLGSVDTENKAVVTLMDIVDPLTGDEEHIAEEDHDHGAIDHLDYDEHVWTSPKNAVKIADAILEAVCDRMPEKEAAFKKNHEKLTEELLGIDESFRALVADADVPQIIVADRFPMLYFCREYGIKYYAAFTGCAASTEPSGKTVQFLIEKVKEDKIPVVFKMDMSEGNVANTVAKETGSRVLTLYSCHTVSAEDLDAGVRYADLMKRNYDALGIAFEK